ncbi:MAG: hypothetical protein ACRESS_12415 [Stenotrophobium sp.]
MSTKSTPVRIYYVPAMTQPEQIVRAASAAAADRIAKGPVRAHVATQDELVAAVGRGLKIVEAGVEPPVAV